jgi:hypothetical protein
MRLAAPCDARLTDKGASHDSTRNTLRLPCIDAKSGRLRLSHR